MRGISKKIAFVILTLALLGSNAVAAAAAAVGTLPSPLSDTDIGSVGFAGSASYDANLGVVTVNGSGADIWGNEDAFHFVYKPWNGDGQVIARMDSLVNSDAWGKGGVMIRESLDKASKHAAMLITAANGIHFQGRLQTGGVSFDTPGSKVRAPYWVKIVRNGNLFSGYESADGIVWNLVGTQTINMGQQVYIGLAVTSHNNAKLSTAKFSEASIAPALEKFVMRSMQLTEPTGLYVLDGAAPVQPQVNVTVANKHSADSTGKIKLSILSRGKDLIWENQVPFDAKVNEVKNLVLPTTALTQGDYYVLRVQVMEPDGTVSGSQETGFGVLLPPHQGLREQSPFGLDLRHESDPAVTQQIAEKIGVKWRRGIQAVDPTVVNPQPGVYWSQADIDKARQEVLDWEQHGVMPLGMINYNMRWNVMPGPNGEQLGSYQNRPKDMAAHVEMVYHSIAPLQDLVKNWEVWNEPWVHGWTWRTGEAQDYRDMLKMIWDRVKPQYPDVMLIGGGSTSYQRDIVYAQGSKDPGYMDGSVNHAYGVPDPAQLSYTELQAYMDKHWSKSNGKGGMWQTELGTAEKFNFPDLPDAEKKYGVAGTVAPIYLLNMLAAKTEQLPIHVFWFSLSYDKAYSGDDFNIYDEATRTPKPAVVAYSAMTHFLEDSRLLEELYPQERSTWGFLFGRQDGKATAALYADKDYHGTVTLNGARGIKVYDYLGKMVADGSQDTLSVALNPWETNYFVSDLSPEDLKAKLKTANFNYEKPVIVSPLSLIEPVKGAGTKIDVQVENPTANTVNGKLTIQAPEGWELARNFAMVEELAPGEKRTVSFTATKTAVSDINRYLVGYTFELYGTRQQIMRTMQGQQTIQVAYAPKKTISVDGDLSDWQDVLPVTMVSNGSKDYLDAIMDPSKAKDIIDNPGSFDNVVYKARTAWDDNYFYFEAEVPDENQASNPPFAQNRYAFPFNADSVQLGFDTMQVNPDDVLYGTSYYDKATSANMDYLFVGTMAQGGAPELHRQMAPGTNKQTYYPTNADLNPPLGPMDVTAAGGTEGKMKVIRDDTNKKTVYEIAVSWNALPDLKEKITGLAPKQEYEGRFTFAVNDAGTNGKGTSYWTKEAGQVQSGSYSYAPFWGTGQKDRGGSLVPRWGFKNEPASYAFDNTPSTTIAAAEGN